MDAKEDPTAPELTGTKLRDSPWTALGNPVVLIAVLILLSVFVLIGSAIFGIDRGVLTGMSRIDFARGLITYLFAIVTIGTAVVLVVSGLTGLDDPHNDRRLWVSTSARKSIARMTICCASHLCVSARKASPRP